MNRDTTAKLVSAGSVGAALAAYTFLIRPWHLKWGATEIELEEPLPGDDVLPHPRQEATHAITINAPIADVWPWLVQVGQNKGGFYSYDWLENLVGCDIHNAQRIVPEWQNLRAGDVLWLHPKAPPLPVLLVEPGRAIVVGGLGEETEDDARAGTWAFVLKELDPNTTRLIVRIRWDSKPGLLNWIYAYGVLEPSHFIMERRMMLGIKRRAEALAAQKVELSPKSAAAVCGR
ncbi:MAG TPA: hypothetical protein VLM38_17270 [Blastocatellia bacterium]|nr:hypothetical protein [Blastocatellia bacterium]